MVWISLFDGISCGRLALERAGLPVSKYFASEVDKYAIKVTQHNYPDTIQMGDVRHVHYDRGYLFCQNGVFYVGKVDGLIGGSPCQGFSYAGRQLNFDDPRSVLYFEYERLLREINPTYFLLENVVMKHVCRDVISERLGVAPILIDSALFSAQTRKRLYWTNINVPSLPQSGDKTFSDISPGWMPCSRKCIRLENGVRKDYREDIKRQPYIHIRTIDKANCLTTVSTCSCAAKIAPGVLPGGRYHADSLEWRYMNSWEYEALQTVPMGYTSILSEEKRKDCLGNGWTVDVVSHIFSGIN